MKETLVVQGDNRRLSNILLIRTYDVVLLSLGELNNLAQL